MSDDKPQSEDTRDFAKLYDALCAYAGMEPNRDTDTLMLTCGAAIEYVVGIAKTHKMDPEDVIGLVHTVWDEVSDDKKVRIR